MIEIKDLSLEDIDVIFSICGAHPLPEDEFMVKGRELRVAWIKEMMSEYGSCIKVAYVDKKPVAQILYYPEQSMKYMLNSRKGVIHVQCIFNPFPDYQKLGAGKALMRQLIEDSRSGIDILHGEKCKFIVSYSFPSAGGITFDIFYSKIGFLQGQNEVYYEVNGIYSPRKKVEYIPLLEDKDKISLFYNPTCEYGYYAGIHMKKMVEQNIPNVTVKLYNLWSNYEEFWTKPQQSVVAGRMVVNQQTINDFLFWIDPDAWLEQIKNRLSTSL